MLKNKIESLIKLIKDTEIEEIEITSFWGAQKIRLSKGTKIISKTIDKSEQLNEVIVESKEEKEKAKEQEFELNNLDQNNNSTSINNNDIVPNNSINIKAPLVGTYYSSSRPTDPPFINVGDKITKGQTICIIEAMKIFNEIESEYSGTITEMLVENGNPVEFDQIIIKILPD
jgi:acetyl-CoA carboxylase biotin carboxyl carrier protein